MDWISCPTFNSCIAANVEKAAHADDKSEISAALKRIGLTTRTDSTQRALADRAATGFRLLKPAMDSWILFGSGITGMVFWARSASF
jgi:hypothetical protein